MSYRERIEQIAKDYHSSGSEPDMFIENCIQNYESGWLLNQVRKGVRLLELGVGDGITMKRLSQHFDYEVIEGSALLADQAEEYSRNSNTPFKVHRGWFEDFESDQRYDVVYASHVLEHVENPSELLGKMKSWLKPSGQLIVIVPNAESLHRRLGLALGLQEKLDTLSSRDQMVGHLRVYSRDRLAEELLSAGFQPILERGFFVKALSNAQMQHLTEAQILGLCEISDSLDPGICANLCVVAEKSSHGV